MIEIHVHSLISRSAKMTSLRFWDWPGVYHCRSARILAGRKRIFALRVQLETAEEMTARFINAGPSYEWT